MDAINLKSLFFELILRGKNTCHVAERAGSGYISACFHLVKFADYVEAHEITIRGGLFESQFTLTPG